MKLDAEEKEILTSSEPGEWRSIKPSKRELKRYAGYAKAALRKDPRVGPRTSTKREIEEGLP